MGYDLRSLGRRTDGNALLILYLIIRVSARCHACEREISVREQNAREFMGWKFMGSRKREIYLVVSRCVPFAYLIGYIGGGARDFALSEELLRRVSAGEVPRARLNRLSQRKRDNVGDIVAVGSRDLCAAAARLPVRSEITRKIHDPESRELLGHRKR